MAATPPNVEVTVIPAPTEYRKTTLRNLFMHRNWAPPDINQASIIDKSNGFGHTNVNNWTIFQGAGVDSKLVARGQGSHINASQEQGGGAWVSTFDIEFEDQRFQGSTIQVMGNYGSGSGQWAVIGGTGKFALATGVINAVAITEWGSVLQLSIDV